MKSGARVLIAIVAVALCFGACSRQSPQQAASAPPGHVNLEDALTLQVPNPSSYSPEAMDMRGAVSGVIGPRWRWILPVPFNGGGSGGAFSIAIFGIQNHGVHWVQNVPTGAGTSGLELRHGVLIAHTEHFISDEPNCCPRGTNTLILGDPHGYIEPLRSWWTLNR